tara:strand:- start:252 stop:461 length:210 start_codon:yes stop_codon:yes gene_type:complete
LIPDYGVDFSLEKSGKPYKRNLTKTNPFQWWEGGGLGWWPGVDLGGGRVGVIWVAVAWGVWAKWGRGEL